MANLGIILIFAALATASPSPAPTAAPDACGGARTNLLAAMDRPSIGFSPCAVKPDERLLETGYANAAGAAGRTVTYPQGLLRFGAGRKTELDVIGPAYALQEAIGVRTAGFQDAGFGAKYELWEHATTALGMDFLYTMPTGAAAFTAGAPLETVNVDYSASLSPVFSVSSTLGVQDGFAASRSGVSGRFISALPSALIADAWNARTQAFLEVFGQTRTRPDGGSLFGVDANLQYLLTPDVEIDAGAGRTVNDAAAARFAGFGFGVRF